MSVKSKTSSGLDFVSTKILKSSIDIIIVPLTFIINNSISSGEFPRSWKRAKVYPVWKKKGSKYDKKNYRPVSLLKAASKVLELIVNKQILKYFEENKLFPKSQHGFRNSRSTFSAISTMHEEWLNIKEKKEHQAISFLDLSAAFDTMSKDILCQKLEIYGFNQRSVKWFHSYLSQRSQCVMIGSTISDPMELNVGSPQGSILSPSLFLILISDIELWCPEAVLCGYADDTSCTVSDKNIDKLQDKCEESVNKLLTYMAINNLSANDDKTHIMVVKHGNEKREITFKVGDAKVKESENEKFLGLWVKNDL